MHNHQLLYNLINPALPALGWVYVCMCVCLFVLVCVEGDVRERDGGVKWISEKRKGGDGQDGRKRV